LYWSPYKKNGAAFIETDVVGTVERSTRTLLSAESDGRCPYMFGPESQADQPGWEPLEEWKAGDQSKRNGRL